MPRTRDAADWEDRQLRHDPAFLHRWRAKLGWPGPFTEVRANPPDDPIGPPTFSGYFDAPEQSAPFPRSPPPVSSAGLFKMPFKRKRDYETVSRPKKRSRSSSGYRKRTRVRVVSVPNFRTGGFLGLERKFYDTARSGIAMVQIANPLVNGELDPTVGCLSAPAAGDGQSARDSRRIIIDSLHMVCDLDFAANINNTTPLNPPAVFVALVLDTQCNGAALESEDVYVTPSTAEAILRAPFRNLEYTSRFKVLKTKYVPPQAMMDAIEAGGASTAHRPRHTFFKMSLKNLNIPVLFNGDTEGVTSVTDNALHLIGWVTSTTDFPTTLSFQCRIRFRDR